MSVIKSFSVGNGDMTYIKHDTDNFTIIDCNLIEEVKDDILEELDTERDGKEIQRFITTHPDDDHIHGLKELNDRIDIVNFYCVENNISSDGSDDFDEYCKLRDGNHAFYIFKGCSRRWMNLSDEERDSSGINILWPDTSNQDFKDELERIESGKTDSPNNISPIIKYSLKDGITALWFGDLENDFLDKIKDNLTFSEADVIFAPHHGRRTGKIPKSILDEIKPKLIIIGEAESEYLDYYEGYNTITQNTAKDIVLDCGIHEVNIYTTNDFNHDYLKQKNKKTKWQTGEYYRGTLELD
ncbi:MAG: MBL fold metallo-hydrolase [Methanobrevibacter sp.]|nr:MBL fold metallo-hydrolase [Methanobrevibacter sp.]